MEFNSGFKGLKWSREYQILYQSKKIVSVPDKKHWALL